MSPRDTSTGSHYESVIEAAVKRACEKNGYLAVSQVVIGEKPGGGNHRVDYVLESASDENRKGLISCKFQQTSGTAEEKIAYEVIKLLHAMENNSKFVKAWIVMGGVGWSNGMRNFVTQELANWIPLMKEKIKILNTDQLLQEDFDLASN